MVELMLLAIALSMDAFAVSIGLASQRQINPLKLSILCGLYFGLFQGLMPLFGFWGGKKLLHWIVELAPWIAFTVLGYIGGKMIYEGSKSQPSDSVKQITHRLLILLAIATSIDAMAAGFALNLLAVEIVIACLVIGIVTFLFSTLGVYTGDRTGTWFERKAEFIGGVILILVGIRILVVEVFH